MSRKQSVEGSEPEEAYGMDLEDALMLDEPGTIVEPDVRKALLKYFKRMKMLEGAYLSRNTETHVTAQQIGKTMKITRRQLKQIIREATDVIDVQIFDRTGRRVIETIQVDAAVARNIAKQAAAAAEALRVKQFGAAHNYDQPVMNAIKPVLPISERERYALLKAVVNILGGMANYSDWYDGAYAAKRVLETIVAYSTPGFLEARRIHDGISEGRMKITQQQLKRIIREQVDSVVNSVTAFDIVDSLKRLNNKAIFAVYMTPRRDDRFEINDRWFGVVDGGTVSLFDAYIPKAPVAIFDATFTTVNSIAHQIAAKIKYLQE